MVLQLLKYVGNVTRSPKCITKLEILAIDRGTHKEQMCKAVFIIISEGVHIPVH